MGLGFNNNNNDNVRQDPSVRYRHSSVTPAQPTDIWRILKGVGGVLATLALLGGLVWGSATLFAGTASDDDLDKLEDRVELVEKNDIVQTVLLQHIKETLDKVGNKLDKALEK